jgi:riboflavin biosynthesis pyrimidine reductase
MKKVLLATIFLVSTFISFAQDNSTAVCGTKLSMIQGKDAGKIKMTLPETISEEDVKNYASYYQKMFTIDFNSTTHEIVYNMVINDANNRRVILRFLSANQIQSVMVEGRVYAINDFYEAYLK